jgi:purine-binding chemotaxis protein CheW
MTTTRQLCTFTVDGAVYGIEVDRVQEVIRHQEMTPVPLAPPGVSGLINLRGQIVTALDLRHRLGLAPRPEGTRPMDVVVRVEEGAVSLLVDEIGDVLDVDETAFERPPETLTGLARALVVGAHKLDRCLLLELDIDRAIAPEEALA